MPHTDEKLIAAIEQKTVDSTITCAACFAIAAERGTEPIVIGTLLDEKEIEIVKCQLGLFGYAPGKKIVKPADSVSAELESLIRNRLSEGRLSCADSWAIAEELRIAKLDVSNACEKLGIKISRCQLGGF